MIPNMKKIHAAITEDCARMPWLIDETRGIPLFLDSADERNNGQIIKLYLKFLDLQYIETNKYMLFSTLPWDRLDSLCLIQHHIVPLDSVEVLGILDDQLVRCHHYVEWGLLAVETLLRVPELSQHFAVLCVSPVWYHLQVVGYDWYIVKWLHFTVSSTVQLVCFHGQVVTAESSWSKGHEFESWYWQLWVHICIDGALEGNRTKRCPLYWVLSQGK